MNYKISYALLWGGLIAGMLLGFGGFFLDKRIFFWVGAAVALLGVLQTRAFYRCPCCRTRFSSHGPLVKVCPNCGEQL